MELELIAAVKALKSRFLALSSDRREDLSVCLLKCNLGVSTRAETERVRTFLEGFALDLTSGQLDDFIAFLHAKDTSLPKHLPLAGRSVVLPAYEDEDTDTEEIKRQAINIDDPSQTDMKPYEPDKVDTLRDPTKPIDDETSGE
jgi:hypothetical protein